MKVLLDEHLSPLIGRALRDRGLDAESVSEREDIISASDEAVMEVAFAGDRAVVTNNVKDFRPIAAERLATARGHAGLILLPARHTRTLHATGYIADAVMAIMMGHPDGIQDQEHWIALPSR